MIEMRGHGRPSGRVGGSGATSSARYGQSPLKARSIGRSQAWRNGRIAALTGPASEAAEK
jgi:hypothetical protein